VRAREKKAGGQVWQAMKNAARFFYYLRLRLRELEWENIRAEAQRTFGAARLFHAENLQSACITMQRIEPPYILGKGDGKLERGVFDCVSARR
jgi:hypothetical protein